MPASSSSRRDAAPLLHLARQGARHDGAHPARWRRAPASSRSWVEKAEDVQGRARARRDRRSRRPSTGCPTPASSSRRRSTTSPRRRPSGRRPRGRVGRTPIIPRSVWCAPQLAAAAGNAGKRSDTSSGTRYEMCLTPPDLALPRAGRPRVPAHPPSSSEECCGVGEGGVSVIRVSESRDEARPAEPDRCKSLSDGVASGRTIDASRPRRWCRHCPGRASARDEVAGVAQPVEHLFCKQEVRGSIPLASSKATAESGARSYDERNRKQKLAEGCPSGQREQAVNLPALRLRWFKSNTLHQRRSGNTSKGIERSRE